MSFSPIARLLGAALVLAPMLAPMLALAQATVHAAQATVHAAQATVAVAANFAEPMRALVEVLRKTTGHRVEVSVGATGRLYAQIRNGAPFDALLAADTTTPAQLEAEGLAVPGSRFTYARGKLVLWSPDAARVDARGEVLRSGGWRQLALANPRTAPYGVAAMQVLERMGLAAALAPRVVMGESIGQTYNFVVTGNAELGFVALSQVLAGGQVGRGSAWIVPQPLYDPIRQDAVLLARGARNEAALALLALVRSEAGRELIRSHGYDI